MGTGEEVASIAWERQHLSLDGYRTGGNLSHEERHLILRGEKDARGDVWRIALVDNIVAEEKRTLYSALIYAPEAYAHYMHEQSTWIHDQFYFLGKLVGHDPTALEKLKEFDEQKHYMRFRIFYGLRWPAHTLLFEPLSPAQSSLARAVFQTADEISFGRFQFVNHYFGIERACSSEIAHAPCTPGVGGYPSCDFRGMSFIDDKLLLNH